MRNRNPSNMGPADKALAMAVMFEQGIVPNENHWYDMRRVFKQLPPEEVTKLKRKFRKLWRQAMRDEENANPIGWRSQNVKQRLGVGKRIPSRAERNARKQMVFNKLWKEVILPMLEKFDQGGQSSEAKKS